MNLTARPLTHEDYDTTLKGWWKDWGWEAPSRDFLPQDGAGGILVLDGEVPVCAGFLYNTNSKVAWVDWIISNKDYKESRKEALSILISTLTTVAKNLDNKFAYALIKHNGLIGVYEQQGYSTGDSYNKEMIKAL
jgi:hypothetical protein|tara:strand:- start:5615 stop:6019 length:405 start_codon:yes stop_codon:yes gene_type:complete